MDLTEVDKVIASLSDINIGISTQENELLIKLKTKSDEFSAFSTSMKLKSDVEYKAELMSKKLSYEQLVDYTAQALSWCELVEFERDCAELKLDFLQQSTYLKKILHEKNLTANSVVSQLISLENQLNNHASFSEGIVLGRDSQKKMLAKAGAIRKNEKYLPLRKLAEKLVNAKKWKSRRQAAISIKPEILTEGAKIGIKLSPQQAEITITGWLKDMGLPANI